MAHIAGSGEEVRSTAKKMYLELTPMDDSVLQQTSVMGDDES